MKLLTLAVSVQEHGVLTILWTQGVSRHPTVVVWAEAAGKPLGQVDVNPTRRDVASVMTYRLQSGQARPLYNLLGHLAANRNMAFLYHKENQRRNMRNCCALESLEFRSGKENERASNLRKEYMYMYI